jgi:hypothetical protein
VRAAIVALLLAVASCSKPDSSTSPRDSTPCVNQVVVIDAGSSGTRARVFQYLDDRPESLVDLDGDCENDHPLAIDIEGVLTSWACARRLLIDPENTPVLVLATGGMRTLAEAQPEQAEQRHADVIAALREQGVVEVESRTISGSDEALYQWIGINHQERRLDLGGDTVTILEFGGASVQVAFALAPEQPVPESLAPDELRTIELAGVDYRVVARSYLHCGMNEAREAMAIPACFPSECATAPSCAKLLPTSMPPGTPTAGNMGECEQHVAHALATDASCTASRSLPPPLPSRPIRLVSALASVFKALGVVEDDHVDPGQARVAAERVCASGWAGLQELGGGAERNRGALCFAAVHALLVLEAWGVAAGDPRPSIARVDDSWTWGVARERLDRHR